MAKYEILYIIRPNIEEEAKNALVVDSAAAPLWLHCQRAPDVSCCSVDRKSVV